MQLRTFLENNGFHRIPLHKMATGHYTCAIKLNNIKGTFIVDTGASTSCIGFEYAEKFGLISKKSDVIAAGAGSNAMKTKISHNNILKIEGLITKKMDFILFDLSHVNEALSQVDSKLVHGILGADYLKNKRCVIDYGRNCLYIK